MEEVEIWKSVGVYKGIDYIGLLEVSTFGNVRTLEMKFMDMALYGQR